MFESAGTSAEMTTYSHNALNQLTAIGGSGGVKTVIVRGQTDEPATVKVKPSIATEWMNARMLSGNRFESDLGLAVGANAINIRAEDGSNNLSDFTYALTVAAATAATPTHDWDGNMLTDGVRSYEWDRMSRLIKITWGAGSNKTTEYRYNALGQRCEQIEKTGTTETAHYYHLYDGIRRIARFNGGTTTANPDRQYLDQGEQRKISSAWSSYYYSRDHLGSVREVMNSNGTLAARYDFDPYGKRRTEYEASAYAGGCEVAYTDHYIQTSPVNGQSELELTHYRAYDPELGRWLSPDPLGIAGGINLYSYCYGNVLNLRDSDGQIPLPVITGAVGAVIGGVIGGLTADEGEFWQGVGSGALSGGLAGLTGGVAGMAWGAAAGGAVSGTVGSIVSQSLDCPEKMASGRGLTKLIASSGLGAATGGLGSLIGSGVTGAMTGSSSAGAIELTTEMINGVAIGSAGSIMNWGVSESVDGVANALEEIERIGTGELQAGKEPSSCEK